jgi:hypothetical protein
MPFAGEPREICGQRLGRVNPDAMWYGHNDGLVVRSATRVSQT